MTSKNMNIVPAPALTSVMLLHVSSETIWMIRAYLAHLCFVLQCWQLLENWQTQSERAGHEASALPHLSPWFVPPATESPLERSRGGGGGGGGRQPNKPLYITHSKYSIGQTHTHSLSLSLPLLCAYSRSSSLIVMVTPDSMMMRFSSNDSVENWTENILVEVLSRTLSSMMLMPAQ